MYKSKIICIKCHKWPTSCYIAAIGFLLLVIALPAQAYSEPYKSFLFFLKPIGTALCILSITVWLFSKKGIYGLSKTCFYFFIAYVGIGFYMLMIGFKNNPLLGRFGGNYIGDLASIILFATGIVFASQLRWPILMKLFLFAGVIGVVGGVLAIYNIDFSIILSSFRTRLYTWSTPYYYWWMLFIWPVMLFSLFFDKNKHYFISITLLTLHVILSLVFIKRVVFLEIFAIIILTIISLLTIKGKVTQKTIKLFITVFLTVMICGFLVLIGSLVDIINTQQIISLYDLTLHRLTEQDYYSFDRRLEFVRYLKDINPLQLIMGTGVGSFNNYLGFDNSHIHIGWLNFLYKGGILLFSYYAIGGLIVLNRFIRTKEQGYSLIFICTTLYYMITSLISTNWGYGPNSFVMGACFFASLNSIYHNKQGS